MSDNKVTLDQLDNSAVEAMSSSVGDVNMLNTENKTIVGALAEIVGKKEIANAIGEPLAENDKFTEMSSEINGLLSTFKTNMMNAGVVVESGDKFKALIDKIKGLTEGEGNKGIQYAEGSVRGYSSNTNIYDGYTIEANFGFTPTILFVQLANFYYNTSNNYSNIIVSNISNLYNDSYGVLWIESFDDTYFTLKTPISSNITVKGNVKWYAIGIGEEDTTLRDSLANILQEEGVSVTEEDDMASLIGKVDEEFTEKNNEIGDMKQGLIDTLTSKGINVDDSLSFDELLDLVNVQLPPTLVLYDNGYVNTEIVGSFTQIYDGNVRGNTAMEMNEDHINVNVTSNYTSNSPVYVWGGIYSELAIDTSKYRAVHVEYSRGNGIGSLNVGMDANKQIRVQQNTSVDYSAGAPITELNTKYIATCSFTPGNFYFLAYIYATNDDLTYNFKIHRIWLDSIID